MMRQTHVPIWAQHTTMAGGVAYEYLGDDPDDSNADVIWLDHETAQIWSGIDWHNANERYRAKAGKAALEFLRLDMED